MYKKIIEKIIGSIMVFSIVGFMFYKLSAYCEIFEIIKYFLIVIFIGVCFVYGIYLMAK